MRENPPHSRTPSAETQQLQMEQSVDQLANLARSGMESGRFLGEVLSRALQFGGAHRAMIWCQAVDGTWQPVGGTPGPNRLDATAIAQRQEVLREVSQSDQPITRKAAERLNHAGSGGDWDWFSPIRSSGQTVAVLDTTHRPDANGRLSSETTRFLAALCEITADFLSQQELQQLRQARTTWQQWDHYSHRLWQSLELASVCATLTNDGRLLVDCDRVSVLVRSGRSYLLQSVSGVDRIEPRSTATRSIESLAQLISNHGEPLWRFGARSDAGEGGDALIEEWLERHVRDSGAIAVGILPVDAKPDRPDRPRPPAVIVFEQFRPLPDPASWQSRCQSLVNRSTPTLQAALERSEIPWLGLWQRIRQLPALMLRPATLCVWAVLLGLLAALLWIPAEFTVSGESQLWPEQRREVFASTSGIVDQILVSHGDEVTRGQPLIVLRDPELEADTPRTLGEIATVNERLKGVQSARLIGTNTPDALSRSRQLTADEEELKERLRTLELQRLWLDERREGLTLRSPIAGRILTWDVAQQLSARPVERGQSLLTIGDTSGPWIVEVQVADKEIGHLLRAQQKLKSDLDVDFILAADPGRTYQGHVQNVSLSVETDDDTRSRIRVVVALDRGQIEQPRPGATAVPRIHCGSVSLGYVWLHDLIDAIRSRLWF